MSRAIEQQILNLIESSIEDTSVPDAIAAHADKRAGKPVTKTDADQLSAALGIPVRICRQYGMTHVSWGAYHEERSVLLAHSESNVRWPSGAELRQKEPAYFGVARERNEARRQLLKEHSDRVCVCRGVDSCSGCSAAPGQSSKSVIARAAEAITKLREAKAELERLVEYGEPLHVVSYDVQKLTDGGAS